MKGVKCSAVFWQLRPPEVCAESGQLWGVVRMFALMTSVSSEQEWHEKCDVHCRSIHDERTGDQGEGQVRGFSNSEVY